MCRGSVLLLAAVLLGAALLLPAGALARRPVWLCKPGAKNDPCRSSLTATALSPTGARVGIEHKRLARRPKVDCFYVYPTVSDQQRLQADLTIDPAERAIAHFQASRFSRVCRVWAPVYRQITIQGLLHPKNVTAGMRRRAYADVRGAWLHYLRHHNHGRGVVLVGHSQGTRVLRMLIRREIDPKPRVRRRLVSAILPGGNVTVRRARSAGGDFRHVRACRRRSQIHCVVAYSAFDATPPDDSRFGRPDDPLTRARLDPARFRALCTNPAALGGGAGRLRSYVPTATFPGTIGALVELQIGQLPSASTPWISFPSSYRGRCVRRNGANVLAVRALGGARVLTPSPDATWGLHLSDVNLPYGNLTALVRRQVTAYLRRHPG